MSRLPEKGDVRRAVDVLDERVHVISGGREQIRTGPLSFADGKLDGDADPIRQAYGDLFDVGEVMQEIGGLMINASISNIMRTGALVEELSTLLLQAMAVGVLQERQRWEGER